MSATRRALLATLGALTTLGAAGCLGGGGSQTPDSGPETASRTDDPTTTATETTTESTGSVELGSVPEWAAWAPAPSALGMDTGYATFSLAPSDIVEYSDALPDSATSWSEQAVGIGLGRLGTLDRFTRIANAINVYRGAVDVDEATSWIETRGLIEADTVGEFDIYVSAESDAKTALGLASETVVGVRTRKTGIEVGAREALGAVLDRDSSRLTEVATTAETTFRAVGAGDAAFVRENTAATQTVDGAAAEGYDWVLGTDQTDVTATFVGEDGRPERESVAAWGVGSSMFPATEPSVAVDGTVATASAAVRTGDVEAFQPDWKLPEPEGQTVPMMSFAIEYDMESGVLTITHDGGDAADASNLYIRGSGFADRDGVDQTAAGTWQGKTSGGEVTAGHTVTVGVEPDYVIRVVFVSDDGEESATLARDEGPEA